MANQLMPIKDALRDENRLIDAMVNFVRSFSMSTVEGDNLKDGWIKDLEEWHDSNEDLIKQSNPDAIKGALQTEREQLDKLLNCARDAVFVGDAQVSGNWWRRYLERERASSIRLKALIP